MNLTNPTRHTLLSLVVSLFLGSSVFAQNSVPTPEIKKQADQGFASHLDKTTLTITPITGMVKNRIQQLGDRKFTLNPVGDIEFVAGSSIGLELELCYSRNLFLNLGLRSERIQYRSENSEVFFPGNPFPQSFQSRGEASYHLFPIKLGYGMVGKTHGLIAYLGFYRSYLDNLEQEWRVEGNSIASASPTFVNEEEGFTYGMDYHFRLGRFKAILGFDNRQSFDDLLIRTSPQQGESKLQSMFWKLGLAFDLKKAR